MTMDMNCLVNNLGVLQIERSFLNATGTLNGSFLWNICSEDPNHLRNLDLIVMKC